MPRLRGFVLALALAGLSAGVAASPVDRTAANSGDGDAAARVRLLSASPDADAWLLGAWMARSWCQADAGDCDPVQAGLLFERVLAQPPDNPTVLRVLIDQLPQILAGDPARLAAERTRLLARVQALDPDSLSSWLPALPDFTDAKRRPEGAAVLARAARSTRAGADYRESYRWIAGHLAHLPLDPEWMDGADAQATPESAHRLVAIAMVHAIATPAYTQLTRWCREPGSRWAGDCRAIARVLAGGETMIDRMIGKAMLERLVSTAAERTEADEVAAATSWLWTAQIQCGVLDSGATLSLMEQEGVTEIGLIEAGLQARGLPLQPPSDAALRKQPCPVTETGHALPGVAVAG